MQEFHDVPSAQRVIMIMSAEQLRLRNENAVLRAELAWMRGERRPQHTAPPTWRERAVSWMGEVWSK